MPLTVTWKDRNVDIDGTRLYRDTKPIDRDNLPPLLAEVGPGVREYIDNDVVRNALYYYAIAPYKGEDAAVSQVMPLATIPDFGPGPQELAGGDHECGFFGRVERRELFDSVSLMEALGIGSDYSYGEIQYWLKYIWQGRICYTPDGTVGDGLSWQDLYNRGLVYGEDGPGPQTEIDPVNQLTLLEKGPYRLKVRLMDSTPLDRPNVNNEADTYGCEWNRIMYPTYDDAPQERGDDSVGGMWSNLTTSDFNRGTSHPDRYFCMHLEGITTGNAIVRGYRYSNIHSYADVTRTDSNDNYGWRPVLELVP